MSIHENTHKQERVGQQSLFLNCLDTCPYISSNNAEFMVFMGGCASWCKAN